MWFRSAVRAHAAARVLFVLACAAGAARADTRRARSSSARCPVGFELTRVDREPVCYRRKGPETFGEKYVGCAGNRYSSALLERAEFTPDEVRLWADYTNLYAGGPLVDWSYRKSTGEPLESGYRLPRTAGVGDELCTVLEPRSRNLTAVACDERHYRYCLVPPYGETAATDCGEGYVGVRSPLAACVQSVEGVAGAAVRATWSQARGMCARRGARLLQRGWRYSNHPALRRVAGGDAEGAAPLGVVMRRGDGLRWSDPVDGENDVVPEAEWNFATEETFATGAELVALVGERWRMVNESYVFYEVLCEQTVPLPSLTMNLTCTADGKLVLNVSVDTLREDDIWCYSDAATYVPTTDVKVTRVDSRSFLISPDGDGYYWCFNADLTSLPPADTDRQLYIGDKQAVVNLYAIKIQIRKEYSSKALDKLKELLWERLSEYVYAWNKFVQSYGESASGSNLTERVLAEFGGKQAADFSKDEVLYDLRVKRVYLDRRTLLLHAHVNPVLFPLVAAQWKDIDVRFMRPVYFCQAFESVPMTPLGEQITTDACRTYSCVGDYNEGVQWVESAGEEARCPQPRSTQPLDSTVVFATATTTVTTATTATVTNESTAMPRAAVDDSSSEEEETTTAAPASSPGKPPPPTTTTAAPTTTPLPSTTDVEVPVTATLPPTTPRPPPAEQVVQELMDELEALVQDTAPVTLAQAELAAEKVDELLEMEDGAELPGRLLHLIDEMGARLELNGSQSAAVIRDNIGLVVADSAPGAPIRGLRLLHNGLDTLTQDAFHIITGDVNDTYLDFNTSEVVVNLPESLVDLERRVAFAVFRNNRAFHSGAAGGEAGPAVNSRVLSVTVSNLTSFDDGDYIDIHLRPFEPDAPRDARRACAYWHFNDDDTGHWSQDGCTLIPSSGDDTLDVCRCTHLTHFAEILAPRTVFPEADEAALEIISIVGCFLSIAGLLLVALTAALFRSWRRDFSNKIWLQLSASIFLLAVVFLVVAFSDFRRNTALCMLSGVVLHYATLASFCWMLVAAVLSYRRLVLVFARDASHKLLRACAFAWGAPCAAVGVLLAVDPTAYSSRFVDNTPGSFCYPTGAGLWVAVYAPIAAALLANWTLFALIVRSVFASRRIKRHGDTGEALRCATVSFLLVFLFGLPWVFGLFSTVLAFAYLFASTATYQGFVLFLFFVVGNKKTRDLWLNKLKIRQMQTVPVTSSSYKSSTRGAAASAAGAAPTTLEAASAKPRSLSGRDDIARFS